jgi:putative FmdB family regulatory protein
VASVFASDLVDFLEDAESAESNVLEVADGSGDKEQASAGMRLRWVGICMRWHGFRSESSTMGGALEDAWYNGTFERVQEGPTVPLYEYQCAKCHKKTEKIEGVSGPHLKKCPHCGGKVERLVTAPAIQFKGAGWYVTDYAGKKSGGDGTSTEASSAKENSTKESTARESASKESKEKKGSKKE